MTETAPQARGRVAGSSPPCSRLGTNIDQRRHHHQQWAAPLARSALWPAGIPPVMSDAADPYVVARCGIPPVATPHLNISHDQSSPIPRLACAMSTGRLGAKLARTAPPTPAITPCEHQSIGTLSEHTTQLSTIVHARRARISSVAKSPHRHTASALQHPWSTAIKSRHLRPRRRASRRSRASRPRPVRPHRPRPRPPSTGAIASPRARRRCRCSPAAAARVSGQPHTLCSGLARPRPSPGPADRPPIEAGTGGAGRRRMGKQARVTDLGAHGGAAPGQPARTGLHTGTGAVRGIAFHGTQRAMQHECK